MNDQSLITAVNLIRGSVVQASVGQCHPVKLGDCEALGDAAVFKMVEGDLISQHGHALVRRPPAQPFPCVYLVD